MSTSESPIHVLVVDDDGDVRVAFRRSLEAAGYAVSVEDDAPAACQRIRDGGLDIVVTDMALPSGSGLDVLATAIEVDPAMPVVFVTGTGDLATAHRALECGALRYLTKPVETRRLLSAMEEASRTRAIVSRRVSGTRRRAADTDLAKVQKASDLDGAIDRLWMAFQPVVSVSKRRVVAYEALVRSEHEPLARPDLLLAAAEDLGRLPELGRRIRAICASRVGELPADADLLINLHPTDLDDPELYDASAPLSRHSPRVILEITERASLDTIHDVQDRIARLRGLGFRIAVDDLGAGYGSLSAIALVKPDLVKLDMSLVRNVDADPVRARMVRSIGAMCEQLGSTWLCEGVETQGELRVIAGAGGDLVQGYLLGRPQRDVRTLADDTAASLPRVHRTRRHSQRLELGTMAQAMCRQALAMACQHESITNLAAGLPELLAALRDLVDHIVEDAGGPSVEDLAAAAS